jgi:uncharacterized membrane protein YedE/YeeE
MEGKGMDDALNLTLIVGGLTLGLIFGVIVQRSRLCMMAAVSNHLLVGDRRQIDAYLVAVAVAILGTQAIESGGWVTIAESSYRNARIDWLGASLGGLMFGFGTTLAGGCAARILVGAAEGSGGALLALLTFAMAATATQFGALEPLRVWLLSATAIESPVGSSSLAALLGLPPWVLAAAVAGACLWFVFLPRRDHRSLGLLVAGATVGVLVVAGWWITGHLAQDTFSVMRPASLTFSAPVARASEYLMTGRGSGSGFDVSLAVGLLGGAWLSSLMSRRYRWVPPDPGHVLHALSGGTLMGTGAILAGGCNIGQGLSGMSTLSVGSLLAVVAIVLGMGLGIAWLERTERVG